MVILRLIFLLSLISYFSMHSMDQVPSLKDKCVFAVVKNLISKKDNCAQELEQILLFPEELQELIHKYIYDQIIISKNAVDLNNIGKIVGNSAVDVSSSSKCLAHHYPIGCNRLSLVKKTNNIKAISYSNINDCLTTLSYAVINRTCSLNFQSNREKGNPVLKVWDVKTSTLIKQFEITNNETIIYFDDKRVITNKDKTITVLNLDNPEENKTIEIDGGYCHYIKVQIFPNENNLAMSFYESIFVLDFTDLSITKIFNHNCRITSIAVSSDNRYILFGDAQGVIYLIDSKTGFLLKKCKIFGEEKKYSYRIFDPFSGTMSSASSIVFFKKLFFNHGDRFVLMHINNGEIFLYDIQDNKILWQAESKNNLRDLGFSSDGSCVIELYASHIYIKETLTGKLISSIDLENLNLVSKEYLISSCAQLISNNQFALAGEREMAFLFKINFLKDLSLCDLYKLLSSGKS